MTAIDHRVHAAEANANPFSMDYLDRIFRAAKEHGYQFQTLSEFIAGGHSSERKLALRLDLDFKPASLKPFVTLARKHHVTATLFVRVCGPYNVLWYPAYSAIKDAADAGFEIGLHTAVVEWATINGTDPEHILATELSLLRSLFPVRGIAPHRDVNYMHNSLPWLHDNWGDLSQRYGLTYHAYQESILSPVNYINEGLSPHLCWRGDDPFDVMKTGRSIYMLLHPHWWYVEHAFEHE